MSKIKKYLKEIETYYIENDIPNFNKLQNGIREEMIFEKLKDVGVKSRDLIELYSWRNGINDFGVNRISDLELFPEGIMLSLEDAMTFYNNYTKEEKIWQPFLFPIFTNGGGDFYLINVENDSNGSIYLYSPAILLSEEPEMIYNSLVSLLDSILSCFLKGAYKYNRIEKCFEIENDLRYEICKSKNPNIKYWEF